MFEPPTILRVGKIEEVVLGIVIYGTDLDGTLVVGDFEYLEDPDTSASTDAVRCARYV